MPIDTRMPDTPVLNSGPYLARVVSNIDPKYMGTLQVQLLRDVGNIPGSEGSTIQVRYMPPFYGVTNIEHLGLSSTYMDSQKSYGMWMVPPDTGTIVMVVFVEGNISKGFWIGCVPDDYMNFMIPGYAATSYNTFNPATKQIVSEYNKRSYSASGLNNPDTTKIIKPTHRPLQNALIASGLSADETRGTTTSSARRETPSMVFGISTPGPIDRSPGGKKGNIGKKETQATGVFVNRLGGSSFVMDDGDANYVRSSHAKDGPPVYVSAKKAKASDRVDIPHNELIRIRTRTGHQILLHNSEDLIYISNSRGTAWIELTSNGKIDIYAADSISMHTKGDFNITADNAINLTAGTSINLNSGEHIKATAAGNFELRADADGKITVAGNSNISAGGNHIESASMIHMNGIPAATASVAPKATRVPTAEPWAGHENLHGGPLISTTDTFKKAD